MKIYTGNEKKHTMHSLILYYHWKMDNLLKYNERQRLHLTNLIIGITNLLKYYVYIRCMHIYINHMSKVIKDL